MRQTPQYVVHLHIHTSVDNQNPVVRQALSSLGGSAVQPVPFVPLPTSPTGPFSMDVNYFVDAFPNIPVTPGTPGAPVTSPFFSGGQGPMVSLAGVQPTPEVAPVTNPRFSTVDAAGNQLMVM